MVNLGDKVVDTITGFEGVVTGAAEYITGCRQCVVQPPAADGKYQEGHWFDEDRLDVLEPKSVSLKARTRDGGPQSNPAPIK